MPKTKRPLYMISVVAEIFSIHPQTLRAYEREGLLRPSRTDGNTRLYSEEDLERIELILRLTKDLGVNLAGVEVILNMRERMGEMQGRMNEMLQEVLRRMETEIIHPLFGYTVSYRRLLEVQARLLARVVSGEIREYPAFCTR